jgi:hypothetical protein
VQRDEERDALISDAVHIATRRRGAFGIALTDGLGAGDVAMPIAEPGWPSWTLQWTPDLTTPPASGVQRLPVDVGGFLDVDLDAACVMIGTPVEPSPSAVMHPWLSTIAALVAHHNGCDTFHGGGVIIDGAAWVVFGAKEAGKSTALAWLVRHGGRLLSDDLVVVKGDHVLSGPACLDLRPKSAAHFKAGIREELLPGRVRWREWYDAPPAVVPLAGFVLPSWGTEVSADSVPVPDRLRWIIDNRAVHAVTGGETSLLRLVTEPMIAWQRPQDFAAIDQAGNRLLEVMRCRAAASAGQLLAAGDSG